jgi:hypothetical protein
VGDDATPIGNDCHRVFYPQRSHPPCDRLDRDARSVSDRVFGDYRCTTEQVRVRVTPLMAWIRDTTNRPRASMLRASARTMTSYGPANGWANLHAVDLRGGIGDLASLADLGLDEDIGGDHFARLPYLAGLIRLNAGLAPTGLPAGMSHGS